MREPVTTTIGDDERPIETRTRVEYFRLVSNGDVKIGFSLTPENGQRQKTIKVRVAIFFDGTSNNRHNAASGGPTRSRHPDYIPFNDSYDSDLTNISRLYRSWTEYKDMPVSGAIYVEGVGTLNGLPDSVISAATGFRGLLSGRYGLKGKAIKANNRLMRILEDAKGEHFTGPPDEGERDPFPTKIVSVELDLFGFSRGAATARYFIDRYIGNKGHILKEKLYDKQWADRNQELNVAIKFVGLFDTVAMFGAFHADGDTPQLGLEAVKYSEYTYQIAAADENRKSFPLTNIDSTLGKGLEVWIPGAHSDIGGGYIDNLSESVNLINNQVPNSGTSDRDLEGFAEKLREQGWYTDPEPKIVVGGRSAHSGTSHQRKSLFGTRKVSNRYTYIPLHMMRREAESYGVRFKRNISDSFSINDPGHPLIHDFWEELNYYQENVRSGVHTTERNDWFDAAIRGLNELRGKYIHQSADHDAIGMSPRWLGNDQRSETRDRRVWPG